MAHCKKFTRVACGHMLKHYERAKDENGDYVKFGNKDIDTNRTHENYNLAPVYEKGQKAFIDKRCGEVKMQKRADVNIMCSWIVTLPKEISNEREEFFKQAYKFLSNRYGEQNVISAYVHLDETTPHMHYVFVPVVIDIKKNILKVSAKEAINRKDLQTFHGDLSKHMEKVFGYDVGVENEATREGNRSIQELERGTAQEKLKKLTEKAKNRQIDKKLLKSVKRL